MMYTQETIDAIEKALEAHGSIYHTAEELVGMAIKALESTDEQKALRANAESQQMRMKHCVCQEGLCHYCRTGEARGA